MRRTAAVLAAMLVALPLLAVAPAQAARTCAIRADYNAVRNGMSRTTVARILHNPGRQIAGIWAALETRKYPVCTRRSGYILVTFVYGKVRAKKAVW